jgi:acylphosphatase
MKREPHQARRWFVSGRVQGVGFRWFVQQRAAELGVSGWARNEDDGRVHVYAVGTLDQLNGLAGHLHLGPRMAEVRGVEEREAPVQQLSSFQIG